MNIRIIKRLLLVILICLTAGPALAKKDSVSHPYKDFGNSVIFSGTCFYFPKIFNREWRFIFPLFELHIADQFSAGYERKVYKNWRLGLGYTTWNMVPQLIQYAYQGGAWVFGGPGYSNVGAMEHRRAYKMYDAYAAYKLDCFRKHKVVAGLGASYCWGLNTYIDSIIIVPGSIEEYRIRHESKADYYGLLASLRYDYVTLRNRVNAGLDFKYRKYFGLYACELDYGVHITFNF
jgi:hypothetical protein